MGKSQLGKILLAKQLRYEDDTKRTLMFYAAGESFEMFQAASEVLEKTTGSIGLAEQLRHHCAQGINILMKASLDPSLFMKAWEVADQTDCLEDLLKEKDFKGRNWLLHAAKAGNSAVFELIKDQKKLYNSFNEGDEMGWNGFMYAARGQEGQNGEFFKELCEMCFYGDKGDLLCDQLKKVSRDEDESTLLMHAAIGGHKTYAKVCRMIQTTGCGDMNGLKRHAVLLSWAAEGGNIQVLNAVAKGIKVGKRANASRSSMIQFWVRSSG